jgi:hypothetical protein
MLIKLNTKGMLYHFVSFVQSTSSSLQIYPIGLFCNCSCMAMSNSTYLQGFSVICFQPIYTDYAYYDRLLMQASIHCLLAMIVFSALNICTHELQIEVNKN